MTRVFVIGQVRLYRDGLREILHREGGIDVVGTAADVHEAVEAIAATAPDIVVLDCPSPDACGAIRRIHTAVSGTHVVVVAVSDREADIVAWADAGVSGYVTRDEPLRTLIDVVDALARGELLCSPRVAATLLRRVAALAAEHARTIGGDRQLTVREEEIVELLERGLSNKEIARTLSLALPTVKNHVHNILDKLEVRSRAEAAASVRRARTLRVGA